jgi:hypothetical protein
MFDVHLLICPMFIFLDYLSYYPGTAQYGLDFLVKIFYEDP